MVDDITQGTTGFDVAGSVVVVASRGPRLASLNDPGTNKCEVSRLPARRLAQTKPVSPEPPLPAPGMSRVR